MRKTPYPFPSSEGADSAVHRPEFTGPERLLARVLRTLGVGLVFAAIGYLLGPLVGPFSVFCHEVPFVANSAVKVAVLGMIAIYAAGDLRRRRALVPLFIVAHLFSISAMALLFTGGAEVARTVLFLDHAPLVGTVSTSVGTILKWAIALDGVIAGAVLVFYLLALSDLRARAAASAAPPPSQLTPPELQLRAVLVVLGLAFVAVAIAYEWGAFRPDARELFRELPFVTNSAVGVVALALVCFHVARNIRRELPLLDIAIIGHVLGAIGTVVLLITVPDDRVIVLGTAVYSLQEIMWGWALLDLAIAVLLFALYQRAWWARYPLRYLRQMELRALMATAEVVIAGDEEVLSPERIADNVDGYLLKMRAHRRWVYRWALFGLQLHPCLYFRPPLSELDPDLRLEHLQRHFYRAVILRLVPDWWRRFIQITIRIATQLTYIGYYNDKATYESVRYKPYSQRPGAIPKPTARHPLDVRCAGDWPRERSDVETDVCIIGSGAAGAILAYHLAEQGREVTVVERGRYVEPRDFDEDELGMVGKLYADGVFQQAEDFRFTILQGSCIGGSTTVNNAVCFAPPESVLRRWNEPLDRNAGLDLPKLRASVDYVKDFLKVKAQGPGSLNPSGHLFMDGIAAHAPGSEALRSAPVYANISDCVGCGYCNIGCAYGKKLSMLDTALPWAQRDFPGKVNIIAECEAVRLREMSGQPKHIIDLRAKLPNGRTVTIRAKTFIVSAGTIASSWLLLRSGVGRGLPVGRHVSFNMGSPLTAEFAEPLDAYAGLQISHYGLPDPERGFAIETWWNPPATQAVNLPGWFEDHFENMKRYQRLMAVGVLVGTESNAWIGRALTGGPGVFFKPSRQDLRKLADGLALSGEILFQAGAKRLMVNTWGYDVFTQRNQLSQLYKIAEDSSYITLGTGHPQGGNAISLDPSRGVVGPDFKVHGYENLYICDASVFPTSTTVNPQLTVMSLAHYASKRIA